MINYNDTVTLAQAMEQTKPPASFLVDTFFPNKPDPADTEFIAVEYLKGARRLAPYVVSGGHGINLVRNRSNVTIYNPPMVGPRRVLTVNDLAKRDFSENFFSTVSAADRATRIQARDLSELQDSIVNRKNKMAADILTTGSCVIEGYADDGKEKKIDTVSFPEWTQKIIPSVPWDNSAADIFGTLKDGSEMIQANAGRIPTILICGKNIEGYFFKNEAIMKWLSIPLASNLQMMSFQPKIISPQVRFIGHISALNLDVYSYAETYMDDNGNAVPFLDPDKAILGLMGEGSQLHGAVTLVEDTGFVNYAASYVPRYITDKANNEMSLTMWSRFVLAPRTADDWVCINTKG